jgi:hypothetical protein
MKNFDKQTVQGMTFYTKDDTEDLNPVANQMAAYARMAKAFMNKPMQGGPNSIVGNYEWHENFNYVKHLCSDIPMLPPRPRIADLFGGPGRMLKRFDAMAGTLDCIDISSYALAHLSEVYKGDDRVHTYETSGIDVGTAPENFYDFIYSTIAMQHIPSRTIRRNIFRGVHNILNTDGWMSVQMAYHPTYEAGKWSHDTEHAKYDSDYWDAGATNGHADCVITESDLPLLRQDLEEIFSDVSFTFENVDQKYANLGGAYHAPYWAQDWIFLKGRKS